MDILAVCFTTLLVCRYVRVRAAHNKRCIDTTTDDGKELYNEYDKIERYSSKIMKYHWILIFVAFIVSCTSLYLIYKVYHGYEIELQGLANVIKELKEAGWKLMPAE